MAKSDFLSAANDAANAAGINPAVFASLIGVESNWSSTAQASGSSAYGLTQMISGTATQMGVTNINDPQQQLNGGAKYLAQMLQQSGGDYTKALEMYNQGPGGNLAAGAGYAAKVMDGAQAGMASGGTDYTLSGQSDANMPDGSAQAMNGPSGSGVLDWVKSNVGNVALVVIGIVTIGVALVASTQTRSFVLQTVGAK